MRSNSDPIATETTSYQRLSAALIGNGEEPENTMSLRKRTAANNQAAPSYRSNHTKSSTSSTSSSSKLANAISKDRFLRLLNGASIPVDFLREDPRTQGRRLAASDLNKDRAVSGRKDFRALYKNIARASGNPKNSNRLPLHKATHRSNKEATAAYPLLDAVATFAPSLRHWIDAQCKGITFDNSIVHLGTTTNAKRESIALQSKTAFYGVSDGTTSRERVWDKNGAEMTLDSDAEVKKYIETFDMSSAQTNTIEKIITASIGSGWRELCELTRIWSQAEKGNVIPKRLILSGHSLGSSIWGDGGSIDFSVIAALTQAMPKAAAQIEDVHVSACYCGSYTVIMQFQAMFPNLQSIMAYPGDGPSDGAPRHLRIWERKTRGQNADNLIAAKKKFGRETAFWSPTKDYVGPNIHFGTLRVAIDAFIANEYPAFFGGNKIPGSAHSGPLFVFYQTLQRALGHRELSSQPDAPQTQFTKLRDQTLRLRYFPNVAKNFQKQHAGIIQTGFQKIGLTVPNFGKLTRAQCLATINNFEAKYRASTTAKTAITTDAALSRLYTVIDKGLRNLAPHYIPTTWTTQ